MGSKNSKISLKKNSDIPAAVAFLAPTFLLIICVTFIPIILAFRNSFHATTYAQVGEFVGLKNYYTVFKDGGLKNILNSVEYVVMSLLLVMPLGVCLGTLLNRKVKGTVLFRTLIIIPWVLSQTVTAMLFRWILNGSYGPITYLIYQLTGNKVDLLSSEITAKLVVVFANVWNTLPVVIILTIAALQTVPPELREAAMMDGATNWQIYTKITLPVIRPTLTTALVMQSIEYFNMVTLIFVLTAGGPFDSTQTLSVAAYQNGFSYWHMDIAAAFSVIIFICNIAFSAVYVRLLKSTED